MLSAIQRSIGSGSSCSVRRAKSRSLGVTRRRGLGIVLRARGSVSGSGCGNEGWIGVRVSGGGVAI
jgi:hypothetical protein